MCVPARPGRAGFEQQAGADLSSRLVREAGYKTACGNNKGSANLNSDLLGLPRIVIERDMSIEDFAGALGPRAGLALRLVGNIKRIPERLGGARFASRVRRLLYRGPLQVLFRTRNLKLALLSVAVLYLCASAAFLAWLVNRSG